MTELVASCLKLGAPKPRVCDLSLALSPGTTVLVGPNGSGKSSLMRLLAGYDAPDAGQVTLDGAPLTAIKPRERAQTIGWLPQNPGADWPMRVADCVAFGRFPYGDADSETGRAIVADAMDMFDLQALAQRPLTRLSGGELARAHLARVWAGRTPLLLLDEPMAALDPAHQIAVVNLLRRHSANGGRSLVILHDLALAFRCADRLVGMCQGRIAFDCAPEHVTPAHLSALYGMDVTLHRVAGRTLPLFG